MGLKWTKTFFTHIFLKISAQEREYFAAMIELKMEAQSVEVEIHLII